MFDFSLDPYLIRNREETLSLYGFVESIVNTFLLDFSRSGGNPRQFKVAKAATIKP